MPTPQEIRHILGFSPMESDVFLVHLICEISIKRKAETAMINQSKEK